ncbi:MAG TPA: recombinase family protein [Acidimicrobiia bacterium]
MDKRTNSKRKAVLYSRVSTEDQAGSGLGLADQREKLEAEATRHRWEFTHFTDTGSGRTLHHRPDITTALDLLDGGEYDVLAVAKLDRVSRSVADFATILERAQRNGWAFVALDLGVDTTTPTGELIAGILMTVAQWERRVISERTTAALHQAKARGVQLGRKPNLPPEVVIRIITERRSGATLQAICDGLAGDGIPTSQGGIWRPATVRKLVMAYGS